MSAVYREEFSVGTAYKMLGQTNISYDQFKYWRKVGHLLLRLIYVTSIHVLSVVVVSPLRTAAQSLLPGDLFEVENGLRDSSNCQDISGPLVKLIKEQVVYFHRDMMRIYPEGIRLDNRHFGVDLAADDTYLQNLFRHSYKPHDIEPLAQGPDWTCVLTEASLFTGQPNSVYRIYTGFDPSLPANAVQPPELKDQKNAPAIHSWTLQERAYVEQAPSPLTLSDVSVQLCEQLKTGKKAPGCYIRISAKLTSTIDLLVYGVGRNEDDIICIILSEDTVDSMQVRKIANMVKHAIRFNDLDVDSTALGLSFDYRALHLGPWNQRATAGQDAPDDVHPRLHMGSGSQIFPYYDRSVPALADHFDPKYFGECPYHQLNNAIQDLLRPAIAKVSCFMWRLVGLSDMLNANEVEWIYPRSHEEARNFE
ncbi:hypothetical protein FRC07_015061 [Ceratobasidium sp. 392]|nr:hypothetical protein FRC07_015061 [Ceratobasidium sp. 392]